MNKSFKAMHRWAASPWLSAGGSIASVASTCWMAYEKLIKGTISIPAIAVFSIAIIVWTTVGIYSGLIRRRIMAFQDAMRRMHKISHDFRDVLWSICYEIENDDQNANAKVLLALESQDLAIKSACYQIKEIFDGLIERPCMVSVKLIDEEENQSLFAQTYIRSEELSERDRDRKKYSIGTGENTGFDVALMPNKNALGVSYFHSADLVAMGDNYQNQRQNWQKYYRSTIVVPIRSRRLQDGCFEELGLLCVDTLSINRLNDNWHVHLLASFADQMFSFMMAIREL